MAADNLFGTDGIRGQAGEKLTPELASRAAFGLTRALAPGRRFKSGSRPEIVVGEDSRLSSPMLRSAISSGLALGGFDVIQLGIVPTPVVPFVLLQRQAAGGVMITASHNPTPDNGIKMFGPDGCKLSRSQEASIEQVISATNAPRSGELHFGDIQQYSAGKGYLGFLSRSVRKPTAKERLKIVLDCAYGATCELAPQAFKSQGYCVSTICSEFDGRRVNHKCGATDLKRIGAEVRKTKADLGLAFDGDGDRVLAVDELGKPVSGDKIIAIFGTSLARYRKQGAVVMTQMTNLGVEETLNRKGVKMVRTEVGDINVLAEMRKRKLQLGGEQSGHIIMLDKHVAGDGILSGLQLASIVQRAKQSLGQLAAQYPEYPQVLTNLVIADHLAWQSSKKFLRQLELIKAEYPGVRFYLRPSGTQEMIRVLTESKNNKKCRQANHAVCEAFTAWYQSRG